MPQHQPPTLTAQQHALLAAALARADHLLTPPARLHGRARQLLAGSLVALGLTESVSVAAEQPAWQSSASGPSGLRLTEAGMLLLGHEAAADVVQNETGPRKEPPPEPRAWTKAARLLALLRREEGADLATLAAATDWLPHTVRAALTGLRRKGHRLSRSRRVSDGATIYRASAG